MRYEHVDLSDPAQDRAHWWAFLNMARIFPIPK
jgi:hypothetical protein